MSYKPNLSTTAKLSTLWIFLVLNYAYGDIMTLMNPEDLQNILQGKAGPMEINEGFLLQAAIYMEVSILMVILSRVLPFRVNKIVNIIAASLSAAGLIASFFVGPPAKFYVFLAVFELGAMAAIVWTATKWKADQVD
jgi:hypothetical protein